MLILHSFKKSKVVDSDIFFLYFGDGYLLWIIFVRRHAVYLHIFYIFVQQASGASAYHPRATWLGMTPGERIVNISAAGIRISVLTDTGRIATFLDESIGNYLCYTYLLVGILIFLFKLY